MKASVKSSITPLMQQYYRIKRKHLDKILLFRMGDFYEMFDEDAKIASKELGLTLTSRNSGKAGSVPLAGFPHHASGNYIAKLIKKGFRVAVCEQVEDPALAKGPVKREVVEIITPGTVMDSDLLDSRVENLLAAVVLGEEMAGYSRIDPSTGVFTTGSIPLDKLSDELERQPPSEIIVSESVEDTFRREWVEPLGLNMVVTSVNDISFDTGVAQEKLLEHFGVSTLDGYGCGNDDLAVSAAGAVLEYLSTNIKSNLSHITTLSTLHPGDFMLLDSATQRNLELTVSVNGARSEGTLFSVIDETRTPMGARLLRHWLLHPLLDREEIEGRLSAVSIFVDDTVLREELRKILCDFSDMERITGRIGTGRVKPRELSGLVSSLRLLVELSRIIDGITNPLLSWIRNSMHIDPTPEELISRAITDNPPASVGDGGVIREGYDRDLDRIRDGARFGKEWIASLQNAERKRTGIQNLKVGYNRVFGYYIEVTKPNLSMVPKNYIRKQTLTNAERFYTPELKEYEVRVLGAEERALRREAALYRELIDKLVEYIPDLKKAASAVAKLDVIVSFAVSAVERDYVKPEILEESFLEIKAGRHPVMEALMKDSLFVPNDLTLGEGPRMALITGPNMAGKSTYLRQVGLIVLLAQAGSFVPAEHASIGIVDRIFTRVGSSDNILQGQSTFLTEMVEMANILNNSTGNSLLLLDEIGRGTSTFDGLSLAWAITEFIVEMNPQPPITLFATHYHELTALQNRYERIINMNVVVKEWGDEVIFLRKVMPGPADRSYGIQVARLAGLPPEILSRAKEILEDLEQNKIDRSTLSNRNNSPRQLSLFPVAEENPVITELSKIEPDLCTPLKALELITKWKKMISERS